MAGEHLPSQPDMSKKDAITGVEQETTSNLTQFRNWVTGGLSHASAMTSIFILTTFNANAQLPKSNDVAKNNDPKKTVTYKPRVEKKDTVRLVKTGEKGPDDPIKNKTEYDAEYVRLLKIRKEVQKEKMEVQKEKMEVQKEKMEVQKEKMEIKAKLALLTEQRDMLMGSVTFLERIQKQNGIVTEEDIRMAKGALRIMGKTVRLPELKDLVISAIRIYTYLAEQTAQTLYTKTK